MARDHDRSCTGPRDSRAGVGVAVRRSGRRGSGHAVVGRTHPLVDHDAEGLLHSDRRAGPRSSRHVVEAGNGDGSRHDAGCTHAVGRGDRSSNRRRVEVHLRSHDRGSRESGIGSARAGVEPQIEASSCQKNDCAWVSIENDVHRKCNERSHP